MAEDKSTGGDLTSMLQNAMSDPRFGEILGMLKEKSASGELDINALKSSVLSGNSDEVVTAVAGSDRSENSEKKENDSEAAKLSHLFANLDNHKRLLAALRPYLSENKREAVDGILKVGQLGELAEKLGGLGGK